MSLAPGTIPPPISWAQRNELLYIIIDVECTDIEHKVTETSFNFKGVNALDATKKYDVTLTFLHPIDPKNVEVKNIGRCLEFTINKREAGPYWPSLTAEKSKLHFLKANFSKWRNESDDEDAGDVGMGGNGLDMLTPNADWNNKFDDFNDDDDDSDDNIPSLSQNDEEDETAEKKKDEEAQPKSDK